MAYTEVPLGQVASLRKEFIEISDLETYKRCRVQLHAKGIVLRDLAAGIDIKTKQQQMCRAGDLLAAEIDAKVGGYGIIPPELDGAIVSSHYFLFSLDESQIDRSFLGYYLRTDSCQDQVAAKGTTNYAAVRPSDVLSYKIPLPPLPEQRRIVARIEDVSEKIDEARQLRSKIRAHVEEIMSAEEFRVWPPSCLATAAPLSQVTTYLARGRQSNQGESSHFLIKTQHVQLRKYIRTQLTLAPHAASRVSSEAIARPGGTLIACSAAGCLGRAAMYTDSDRIASTDTHVAIARPNPDIVTSEYLYAYLSGAQGQVRLRSREQGDWTREKVGFRLAELNLADLREVPVPVPSREEQERIVRHLSSFRSRLTSLQSLQHEAETELSVLQTSALDHALRGEL